MHVLLRGVAGVLLLLAAPSLGGAKCGDDPADAEAVARAGMAADAACDTQLSGCSNAPDHGSYVHCVATQAKAAVDEGTLQPACKRAVTRCAARSTCGRPGAVTCCRTKAGETRCSIKSGTADCTAPGGGTACVGTFPSCCDACGTTGCAGSTTTSTSATTTSTTLQCHFEAASNGCQGGCPGPGAQCVLIAPDQCDCRLPGCHTCWLTVSDFCTDMPCSSDADCTEPNLLCLADKCEVPCPTTTTTSTTIPCQLVMDEVCAGGCPSGTTCLPDPSAFGCTCLPAEAACRVDESGACGGACADMRQRCGIRLDGSCGCGSPCDLMLDSGACSAGVCRQGSGICKVFQPPEGEPVCACQ